MEDPDVVDSYRAVRRWLSLFSDKVHLKWLEDDCWWWVVVDGSGCVGGQKETLVVPAGTSTLAWFQYLALDRDTSGTTGLQVFNASGLPSSLLFSLFSKHILRVTPEIGRNRQPQRDRL